MGCFFVETRNLLAAFDSSTPPKASARAGSVLATSAMAITTASSETLLFFLRELRLEIRVFLPHASVRSGCRGDGGTALTVSCVRQEQLFAVEIYQPLQVPDEMYHVYLQREKHVNGETHI